MRFFFYGTLLDQDIRRAVLGPSEPTEATAPASLPGYARFRAAHGNYPILARRRGRSVAGQIFEGLSPRQVFLIAHFEGREYRPVRRLVVDRRFREQKWVWVFFPVHRGDATVRPWNAQTWKRRDKPVLLRRIHRWARELHVGTLQSQDIAWPARRSLLRIVSEPSDRERPQST